MQSAQLPEMTKLTYLGSTLQSEGGMNAEVKKSILCVLNNWINMSGVKFSIILPTLNVGLIYIKLSFVNTYPLVSLS